MPLVRAVATVTLVGLGPGEPVWVDTADPQVARWLRGGQLRELNPLVPSTSEPEAEVEVSTPDPEATVENTPAPRPRRAAQKKVTK